MDLKGDCGGRFEAFGAIEGNEGIIFCWIRERVTRGLGRGEF